MDSEYKKNPGQATGGYGGDRQTSVDQNITQNPHGVNRMAHDGGYRLYEDIAAPLIRICRFHADEAARKGHFDMMAIWLEAADRCKPKAGRL